MDKQYAHQIAEKEMQTLWEQEKTYHFDENSKKEVFSIDTPPPTVSGALHIGHIFSYTQTDLLARYKRMQGYNVFYPMGFDNNGLATERFVEKKHEVSGHAMKRSDFIALCLKESEDTAKMFAHLWQTLGLSIDWTKTYTTISPAVRKLSQETFIELYKKGLVYKKEEPALYCTTCRTTVAQAELDSTEVASTFNDIVFKLADGTELMIATTRPELLPACVAIFFHPEDSRYTHLKGKKAITPVFNQEVPILPDEAVDKEKGTGLVMCCTFGDQTDVAWFKKHNLPFVQVVGRDGRWTAAAGALAGLKVHDARKKVLELLQEQGLLRGQKQIQHAVGTHERCKKEIEFLILNQWFIKILEHRQKFLELADQINWKPVFMKARYKDWVEHLGWDWCISRQRFYGIPFPVWHCADCGHVIMAEAKDLPIDPQETAYLGGKCPKCSSANIVPETDVMDTWNTSSITPQVNCGWPELNFKNLNLPMSLRPQAHDIIRTWTFYTIVKAFYLHNSIPWKEIALSGYVVAKGREKISKSKGNAPTDPEVLLKAYPADAIRYWSANGRLGVDTQFSEDQFKVGVRLLTKLWNAFRFCSEHLAGYQKQTKAPELTTLNQWLLDQLNSSVREYKKQFDAFEYTSALEAVEKFFWNTFCDNYLEFVKDQMFNPDKYSAETIAGTRYTLYETCYGLLQLFAPFIPHLTEYLYQQLFKAQEGAGSLHNSLLDEKRFAVYSFAHSAQVMSRIVDVVAAVRKLKSENNLSLKVEIERLTIYGQDENGVKLIKEQEAIIAGVMHIKQIVFSDEQFDANRLVEHGGAWQAHVRV